MRHFSIMLFCIMFSGCSLLQFDNLTPEEQEQLVHDVAQAGVSTAIVTIYNDDQDKQVEHARELKVIFDRVVSVLNRPNVVIDDVTANALLAAVPREYSLYLQHAMTFFRTYYKPPAVGEVLDEQSVRTMRALFSGLSDGCQMVVDLYTNPSTVLYLGTNNQGERAVLSR